VHNVATQPFPPTGRPHASGDYIGIRRTAANAFRCSYAAQAAPTSWSDLTGDVIVNSVTNPGRGGLYFYGDQLRAAQFEVGDGSALPTAHACGAASAPPGGTATATATGPTPSATSTPVPGTGCPTTPAMGCFSAGKSKLLVRFHPDPGRRKLLWKWSKGTAPLAQADFGDPESGGTSYTLCVYDQSAGSSALAMSVPIAAGGTCHGRPCWKPLANLGWIYRDRDRGLKMLLTGGSAGAPKAMFKQKNPPALPTPVSGTQFFNQDTAVVVQLHSSGPAACWSTAFDQSTTRKNDGGNFRATIP
jgi:hypothetical protein